MITIEDFDKLMKDCETAQVGTIYIILTHNFSQCDIRTLAKVFGSPTNYTEDVATSIHNYVLLRKHSQTSKQ